MSTPLYIPVRSRQAILDLIDLSGRYTATLDDAGMAGMPTGVHAYSRAAFDVRGAIQLAGTRSLSAPKTVNAIAVNQKGERIHFLHGAAGVVPADTVIGTYVLHYADGQTRSIPLVFGRNIGNSFGVAVGDAPTDAVAAWTGRNVRLYKYTACNPLPGVEITAMDFVSTVTEAAPFLVAVTVEPAQENRTYEWFDSIRSWNPIPPRDPLAGPDQVDLTPYYGTSLDDDWFDHAGHDLHEVPQGLRNFGGVVFDVRGLIVLAGCRSLEVSGLALPEATSNIPVGRRGKALHFLQASAFVGSAAGEKIGEYVIHYENGERRTADLVYGENIMDWWVNSGEGHVTRAEEVWYGSNPATRRRRMQTRLIKYTWKNPLPEVVMTAIDFVSAITNAAPMLIAITVEP